MMLTQHKQIALLGLLLLLPLLACRWLTVPAVLIYAEANAPTPTPTMTPIPLTPTLFPTPLPLLRSGMAALVQTGGDVLFLRDAPGTEGEILLYLYDDDVVTLLEGPVENGLYRWWRVRTEDGVEGWAAAASGELTTLLPDVPRTATPTPQATFTPMP